VVLLCSKDLRPSPCQSQSGRIGEAPAERGSLSEYFPSIPIMAALMGKAPSESASGSAAAAGGTGFKGFAMVRGI